MRICPKCEKCLSPLYFKTVCRYCGADLFYYHFDERLEQDAAASAKKPGTGKGSWDVMLLTPS